MKKPSRTGAKELCDLQKLGRSNRRSGRGTFAALFCLAFLAQGCSNNFDASSPSGKEATLTAAEMALTSFNCSEAIAKIDPVYNSANSDNDVRKMRAAAYGCAANINWFPLVGALAQSNLAGPELWNSLTRLFPSTDGDDRLEAAWGATDALFAMVRPGKIVADSQKINVGTHNEGSLQWQDRDDEGNFYLLFVSFATIGSTHWRYGKTASDEFDSTYHKRKELPWNAASAIVSDEAGCAYAGAILNVFDSIDGVASSASGNLRTGLQSAAEIGDLLDYACLAGCMGASAALNPFGFDFDTGCTLSLAEAQAQCVPCPLKVRHKSGCVNTSLANDKNPVACSAAGLVNFMNKSEVAGWVGP